MKKFLIFFVIMSFFSSSRPAASYAARNHDSMLRELKSLTQPESSSDLPFSPSNAHYSANGQLLEIDPATTVLAQETYWTPDFTLIPITTLRRPEGITLVNHTNNPRAESTATHFNWPIDPSQFSNPFHPPSVSLHPHQLRVAFTDNKGDIVFINFTRDNFSVTEKPHSHTTRCHEGVGPQILFGPNDLFATELHGQVCIYNQDNPEGKIITPAFSPFDRPLADSSAESLLLDRQLHEKNKNTCPIEFNPHPLNEQLVVHYKDNLYIFNGRTGGVLRRIRDVKPISSFTRRGDTLVYLKNNNDVITLDTRSLELHRLIKSTLSIVQIDCCPFSNPLLLTVSGNSDKKIITVYDMYKGEISESSDPNFEKVGWVPNTKTVFACTNPENNVPQIKQWDLDQTSRTYRYAQEDHGAFNIDKIHFFDSLIWQINNGAILQLQDGQDLSETFSQFPPEVQSELLATGKIIFSENPENDPLDQDQEEPDFRMTPPPSYEAIFGSTNQPPVTDRPTLSRFQRVLAALGLRRRLRNNH
jgi:hypothetical protein